MKKIISNVLIFCLLFGQSLIPLSSKAISIDWDVEGNYVFSFDYQSSQYPHNVSLTQNETGQVTGNGEYAPYTWVITNGTVVGNNINLTANYTATSDAVEPQTVMNITGTIANDGSMSGTWTDNYQGGERAGTWMTTSGNANEIEMAPTSVKVTIVKYINGEEANTTNTNNTSFPMTATWNTTNIGSGTGNYNLSATGYNNPNPYRATTSDMNVGADYSTYENTGSSCIPPMMYALAGYTTGNTLEEAKMATPSLTVPELTNLQSDKFIIVWNKTCVSTPVHLTPANNSVHLSSLNTLIDWTESTSWATPITYVYQASYDNNTNPDGSFVNPVYTSETLTTSDITSTGATPATYFWNVRAKDVANNFSAWTAPWKLVISNTLSETIVVNKNTSAGENQPGWMFNRDLSTSTPYEFNKDESSIGLGSLYVKPIGSNPSDKFIAENFINKPISEVEFISYDFMIGEGGSDTQKDHFYMNVYANFGVSDDLKFYDCRYNVVPTVGSTGAFTTVTFDPTMSYPVTTRTDNINTVINEASPFTCPSIPADMDDLSPGSNIRAFALNLGQSNNSDLGVHGYFDKVVVKANNFTTTYDFEKFETNGQITNPTLNQTVSGTVNLTATYDDNDEVNDDAVQWAVRKNSCSSGTVAGNVDSFSNVATWNGKNFSYSLDTSLLENGTYCFVFNPTDDAGENNVRETVNFTVDNTVIPETGTLIVKKIVVNNDNGIMTAGDFSFSINTNEDFYSFTEDEENNLLGEKVLTLEPGIYTVNENEVSNYAPDYSNCTEISVIAGETTTCTITNDDFVHSGGNGGGSSFTGTPSSNTGSVLGASTENTTTENKTEGKVLGDTTCTPYLTSFMKFGEKNDKEQVKLLQTFLNENLGLSLKIDGIYGISTKNAVIKFQEKYKADILDPWIPFGLTNGKGTGAVYKTTLWKINALKCEGIELPKPQLP